MRAYAHDLKDWFTFLAGHDLDRQAVALEDVVGFVGWLRLPPAARDSRVRVLPTVEHHCGPASVNRKLAASTSFCEFHARHGVALSGLMVGMQPPGRGRAMSSSYKPFLHHVRKDTPQRRLSIVLPAASPRTQVLTAGQAQVILDACWHLRDRLLFAVLLDAGLRVGEPLRLRHEDLAVAAADGPAAGQRQSEPRQGRPGPTKPVSPELIRLLADYLW